MGRIEKTVFISYRRDHGGVWARAIYQDLVANGYDAFFDFQSIDSGDFSRIIIENIKARAHFLVLLAPSALERCDDPNDWLRREIETAIEYKRNIVPIMLESFDFGNPDAVKVLTGKLATLKKYNALRIYADYFEEGMARLRNRYLNVALDAVLHPVSQDVQRATQEQQFAANNARPVKQKELTSYEWFEKGLRATDPEEKIRYYDEAIHLKQNLDMAYLSRGNAYYQKGDFVRAVKDYTEVIRLKPADATGYANRGNARRNLEDLDGALKDLDEAIRLKPDYADAYINRGIIHEANGDVSLALADYKQAVQLKPDFGLAVISLFSLLQKSGSSTEAREYEDLARKLMQNENEYNQACFEAICGNKDKALELLKIGLEKKQGSKEWARRDPDFENLREDPRFKELVGE